MQKPNPYQNYATRQIVLSTGIRTKVLDFDRNTGDTWQAWIFSNDVNDKSTNVEFELRGSFGTNGTIETTIGGGGIGGDLITGTGSCEVYATGQGNNTISVWFTPEQTSTSLPPVSQSIEINTAPAYTDIGYPPFARPFCTVYTTANYTIQLRNDNGDVVITRLVTSPTFLTSARGFFHPPNTTLELLNSVANQKFIIQHTGG